MAGARGCSDHASHKHKRREVWISSRRLTCAHAHSRGADGGAIIFRLGIAYEPPENVAPNFLMFLPQFVYILDILQIFESLEKGTRAVVECFLERRGKPPACIVSIHRDGIARTAQVLQCARALDDPVSRQ
jgi:hypothetical protein